MAAMFSTQPQLCPGILVSIPVPGQAVTEHGAAFQKAVNNPDLTSEVWSESGLIIGCQNQSSKRSELLEAGSRLVTRLDFCLKRVFQYFSTLSGPLINIKILSLDSTPPPRPH